MDFYALTLGTLCVWRITHLLHAEDGPWNLLARLRGLASGSFWHGLIGCFYCLSLWVGAPFAFLLASGWRGRLLLWPALSGGASLLERRTWREAATPPATYFENEESPDVRMHQDELPSNVESAGHWSRMES